MKRINIYIYNGTVDDCKAICNVIPRCHGFSRTRTGNTCHFKKELNSFITNPNTMTNHDSYETCTWLKIPEDVRLTRD